MSQAIERLLALAQGEIGVSESPAGSNRVKYNTAYYGREVSGGEYPWCCVFLWWLFKRAGLSPLFYGGGKTASCGALATYAKAHGQFITGGYQAGDLVFLRFSGKTIQHIGIVESVKADGTLVTIEGNTGTGNDANGGQVQRRTRAVKWAAGGYRPVFPESGGATVRQEEEGEMTQEQFNTMMETWMKSREALSPGEYSQEARAWAEGGGIVLGDGQGNMQYKSFCTREQMLVFLHRFSQQLEN